MIVGKCSTGMWISLVTKELNDDARAYSGGG
jgi:hypothetical protein